MNEGDDTILSNLGAILWSQYRSFPTGERRSELKIIASKYKGGEDLHYYSWSDELIKAAENGDEQSKFELIDRYNDILHSNIDFSGWIKNIEMNDFEYDVKAIEYGKKIGVFKCSNPFKDHFISQHIYHMIIRNGKLVRDTSFYNISYEHCYWIGKFAYEMRNDLYIDERYQICINYYFETLKKTREAIDTWSIIAKRLGVVKDIRIVIGKLLWKEKTEWIPPKRKHVEYEETRYYDWEWIKDIMTVLIIMVLFISCFYEIGEISYDYFTCKNSINFCTDLGWFFR